MSRDASSSLPATPPNKTLQRTLQEKIDSTHAQKRLHHLTKVAVHRAYKLLAESRCLVPIVDTRGCGYTKRLEFSSLFSSSLLENAPSSSAPPSSSSKNWALSMDSNLPRLSVAARIHTLLTRWRADSSVEWRARVASVVPVFEGVLHKQAKSGEELTNPRLLEAHLLTVLRHFEAGNGPFLLQGSSPPYPAQECHPPSSPSDRVSPSFSRIAGQSASKNRATHHNTSMKTLQSFASSSSPISTEASIDTSQNICSTEASNKRVEHAAINKIAKKVASVFTKERSGKSVCFKEGHENANRPAEAAQRPDMDAATDIAGRVETMNDLMLWNSSPNSICHSDGRMRQTLGGMLELNMVSREGSTALNEEPSPLSDHAIAAEAPGVGGRLHLPISEMERPSRAHSSTWVHIIHTGNGQGRNCAGISMSQTHMPPSLSTITSPPPPSSTVVSPPCTGMFISPSRSEPPTLASAPSRSRIPPWSPHQAAFSAIPPPSRLSSSSPSQEPTQSFNARHKPLASSLARQCAPPSTSSDKPSVDQNHLICKSGGRHDHSTASTLLHANQAMEAATHLTLDNSIIRAAPQAHRWIEIGESSSGPSMTSSPSSASYEEASKVQVKGMRLPLRSFLADKEDQTGYSSSYKEGGPWDTWEETTEELDGMCCVCMVGFKGAAFVPCGHTFCRKCSRELWRGRGTCPLCNKFIREILDIY